MSVQMSVMTFEFTKVNLPLPTIEENGGGVIAIIQRKTLDELIRERDKTDGGNVGVNDLDVSDIKLSERQ